MKLINKILCSLFFGSIIAIPFGAFNINYLGSSIINVLGFSCGIFLGMIIREKIMEKIKNKNEKR